MKITYPPALPLVPLHLLPEDVNLLMSLVQLHLSLLLCYLIFASGSLQLLHKPEADDMEN